MPPNSTNMSGKTLDESVIHEKIMKEVAEKLKEIQSDTKTQIDDLQVKNETEIRDLRADTDTKINGLKSSVRSVAGNNSDPFWFSFFVVFGFQYLLLFLLLANKVDINSDDNPLNLPANVETPVRISQVLLIIIALFSQDDLLVGIESLTDGLPNLFCGNDRFKNMTRLQWRFSSIIRLSQGLLNLLAAFVLSVQSETVPDVLLNVLGVGFISNLDNLAFSLSLKGYFGEPMKVLSDDLCAVVFHRSSNNQQNATLFAKLKSNAHIVTAFAVLLAMLIAFAVLSAQQDLGTYSEQDIQIEFGDEVLPFLGLFNGCFEASDSSEHSSGRLIYEQVGFPNGGKFGFCSDFGEGEGGWAFFIGEKDGEICDDHIVRSGETSTFSLLDAATNTKWYTADDLPLDYLEITEVKTPNSECGQSLFTDVVRACPSILDFDSLVMPRVPVPSKADLSSRRSLDASISHPIYYNETQVGSFTLIFFTGRRWIQTKSDHISALGNETNLSNIQDYFFVHDGLFSLINDFTTSVEDGGWVDSISEIVDATRDQGTPLGLQWYAPRYELGADDTAEDKGWRFLGRNVPSADLSRPISSVLICLHCNNATNPCLYEGVCKANGECDCKHGASGRLCRDKPLGDGVCNVYFNTPEHQYDGGDCCANTCVGEKCGQDDRENPYSDALSIGGHGWYIFENITEEWNSTFHDRKFAFGVDLVSDGLAFSDDDLPLLYEHCVNPNTVVLAIGLQSESNLYAGINVRCNEKVYFRSPKFFFRATSFFPFLTQQFRVDYGARCEVEIDTDYPRSRASNVWVYLFADGQQDPFVFQMVDQGFFVETNGLRPVKFQIPDSECVWKVFLENRISVSETVQRDDSSTADVLLDWNHYMTLEPYTKFSERGNLGYICDRDPEEIVDRYAVWAVSEFAPVDLSPNFVGHVCNSPWNLGFLPVSCNGRRVNELSIDGVDSDQIHPIIKNCTLYLNQLERLQILNLYSPELPTEIGHLFGLTRLVLSNGELTSLPSEIGNLTSLTFLDLENNELTSLPPDLGKLTSLTGLRLNVNVNLTSLPSEVGRIVSLTELGVAFNALSSIPSEMGRLTSLTSLDLSGNELTSLPSEMGRLTSLTSLNLRSNELTSLPTEIDAGWTSLTSLELDRNELTSLPAEIGVGWTSLRELDLNFNKFTSPPSYIGTLTSLTMLNLNQMNLTSLPSELGRLTSLEELYLEENKLNSLPSELGGWESLKKLILKENELNLLPSEVGLWTSLEHLDLESNQLTSLPSEIGAGWTSLGALDLEHNQLTSLPPDIGRLTLLENLDLSHNNLTSLPSDIGGWTSITDLSLSHNDLTSLPSDIGRWTSLWELDLSHNNLTSLPSEIAECTSLVVLRLSYNQLTSLPSELCYLRSLNVVFTNDIEYNCDEWECEDIVGWVDGEGHGCDLYESENFWCYIAYAYPNTDGIDATDACCFCGGGVAYEGGDE